MSHKRYVITTSFNVCHELQDKVLDEIKQILQFSRKTLDHASDIKTVVTHLEVKDL
jgi:hypothetical protein